MEQKKNKVLLIIFAILSAFGLIGNVLATIDILNREIHIIGAVMFAAILVYLLIDYSRPHGNLLKYTLLLFGVYAGLSAIFTITFSYVAWLCIAVLLMLVAVGSAYMAGKLGHLEKSKILFILNGIFLLAASVISVVSIAAAGEQIYVGFILAKINPLLIWAALGIAYTSRYEEHKQAGIEEDAANKAKISGIAE